MKNLCRRTIARQFALIFLPTALGIALATELLVFSDARYRRTQLESQELARVEVAGKLLGHELYGLNTDLRLIAGSHPLDLFVESGGELEHRQLEEYLVHFARVKGIYDQLRYLDNSGRELVRINFKDGDASPVTPTRLQDKGNRYYFPDTMGLGPNEIYVSGMDLNVEGREIEQPLKPMLRVATPIDDAAGNRRGMLVLNYLGIKLIDHFREAMGGATGEPWLLDQAGYCISSPDPAQEWGMMRKNGSGFGDLYPDVWHAVAKGGNGSLLNEHGLFVYGTVSPLGVGLFASQDRYQWIILSRVPAELLPTASPSHYPVATGFLVVLLILAAIASWQLAHARVNRRAWQQALEKSEARFRAIFQEAGVGIVLLGPGYEVLQANPALERLLDYGSGQLEGQAFELLFSELGRKELGRCLEDLMGGRAQVIGGDHRLLARDGRELVAHVLVSAIRDTEGKRKFAVALVDDLTDRQQAAAREAELQAQLAHIGRVGLMGELTATLAHELNNPLGIIANYAAGCIKRIEAGAPARTLLTSLEKIGHQARVGGEIICQVRGFVAKGQPDQGVAGLPMSIDQAMELLEARLDRSGTTVSQQLDAGLPSVMMPQVQLQQIFLNLLMNAVEAFQGQAEGQHQILIRAALNDGGMVEAVVTDNGPLDRLPTRLFEPFYTTKPAGLGMGLAICHTLVEMHGGRIWGSVDGAHGLSVHFTLPPVTTEPNT